VNWTKLTENLPTLACGDIVVVQSNPNILYLGTGELNYSQDSQYGNGIYNLQTLVQPGCKLQLHHLLVTNVQ